MIAAVTGGEVALYHNNSLKLSTTATGASVTNAGGSNNDDTANAFHISGTEHLRAVIDTASTSGHRASLVLESNSQETVLSTTGAASELVVPVGGFTLDVAGDITLDADDGGHVRFKDGGTQYASIFKSGSGAIIDTPSGGDITLDSANDIILDAAGNDIIFKDAGTTFGQITNDSGNMIIYNAGSQMLKGLSSGSDAQFMGKLGIGSSNPNTALHIVGLNQTNGTLDLTPNAAKGSHSSLFTMAQMATGISGQQAHLVMFIFRILAAMLVLA